MNAPDKESLQGEKDFVFSTYFLALKDAWKGRVSGDRVVRALYEIISVPLGLVNRLGGDIYPAPANVSRLKNRSENVHRTISANRKNPLLEKTIFEDFNTLVMRNLEPSKIDLLVSTLIDALMQSRCSEETKDELLKLSQERPSIEFLVRTFQESLAWYNKLEERHASKQPADKRSVFPKFGAKIDPEVPDTVKPNELPYVHALVEVYGEEEGRQFLSAESLDGYPRHQKHLQRQRRDYYSAEFVRRCMRDAYDLEGDDQFEVLEDEIYDGVIDTHCRKFPKGRDRLDEVLSQAARVNVDGCWVNRDTDWIKARVKKGVCHLLVNDKKISGWLDDDR